MSGIFPTGGVTAENAINTVKNPDLASGCKDAWHAPRCTPRFDPASANAVISEIINAVNCAGLDYDCDKLTNLCDALEQHVVQVQGFFPYQNLPFNFKAGADVLYAAGSGLIKNDYRNMIIILGVVDMPLRILENAKGQQFRFSFLMTDENNDTLVNCRFEINNQNETAGSAVWNFIPTRQFTLEVPPGGMKVDWKMTYTCSQDDAFTLNFTDGEGGSNASRGISIGAFGSSYSKLSRSFL